MTKRKRPTEAWLRARYESESLDCTQIARLIGCNPKTVWSWLKAFGITTRPPGSNYRTNLLNGRAPGFRISDEQKEALRQARLRDGSFPKNKDGRPYWTGKVGSQHPTWRGGATPERQAFYGSAEWKHARKIAYTAAGGCCERCGSRGPDLHIHHVIPFVVSRTRAVPSNLRVLCRPCHLFVHGPNNGDREFLPWFAILPVIVNGKQRLIRMNYRPTHKARLPQWIS